jgi:hypothetical protein
VSADYERIREENIARYGWDTAVLDLLGQLYSERTHFIFELIQNAEDAGATELAFELFADRLELRHDGRPFSEADVRGVCGVGQSGKSGDLTAIGKFGIGFKSVYAYTRTPHVYSGDEHFRIQNYVRPYAVSPLAGAGTLFVFPFDHDEVPAATAAAEISAALAAIEPAILLFLAHIARLRVGGAGVAQAGSVIERRAEGRAGAGSGVGAGAAAGAGAGLGAGRRVRLSKGRARRQEWLVWQREVEGLGAAARRVEIAFRTEEGRIAPLDRAPLSVFFPTEKETFLGFVVQGPYRTTPARDNVPEHDPSNQVLVRETAALLAEVLPELRDGGLLTATALAALPVDAARFAPGSMFRPLFNTVREALSGGELIPVAGGGHRRAADVLLARDAGVHELLDPRQLGALYGTAGSAGSAWFADEAISEGGTPVLWRYLRDEIGLAEATPEGFVAHLSGEFLQAQSDEWITRLYAFLFLHSALWQAAGVKPIIRLEDGSQVAALDDAGRPAVYLPGAVASGLPTVRRAVADSPSARRFLDALELTEPDVVAEVLELVLPRYERMNVSELDPAQHDADLELVMNALDVAAAGRRAELLGRLRQTAFLIGENAATGEQRLMPPPALYQRTKDLETYFEANPDAWFAADRYGPWLVQLRGMGVRQAVQVRAREPDQLGHVIITAEFGRNERGLDGFDPDAEIDGLDFALAHPSHARSEYVWNVLLAPNRRLVAGGVERSVLASFSDATVEGGRSAIAAAAEREAWLPGPDATFVRPAELSLDDLPPTWARDEGLAQALHMLQPVVAEAARQLGVPVAVLWGLKGRPDLVAMIERELAIRAAGP